MPRLGRASFDAQRAQARLQDAGQDAKRELFTPTFLEDRLPPANRTDQLLALLLLPMFIIASLAFLVAINQVMADIFGSVTYGGGQDAVIGWLITGLTGALFMFNAWLWFQFVRTGAFGILRTGDI